MSQSDDLRETMRGNRWQESEPTPEVRAKREVASALRTLVHAISGSGASLEALETLAAQLGAHADDLTSHGSSGSEDSGAYPSPVPGMENFRDRSPITGHANPLAPPATLVTDMEAEVVRGEVTFGPAFEGAPGIVHGGFVAALLDEALGMACIFSGGPAMTAELTTRYRTHTPVAEPLRVEARLVSVDGRKIQTEGAVFHGDDVIVEGSGLFIAVDVAKFAQLAEARSERAKN
jgi:acyl-coenzyme A thioesterase PaaI-like protein